jgi:hypothetical protein
MMKLLSLAAWLLWPMLGSAQALHQYPDADLALGQKLLREHDCAACHVRRVGGDGSSIYRPAGRINTPSSLVTMVEVCNTELKLQMFPEDVVSVAAVLQRDHYRFVVSTSARKP